MEDKVNVFEVIAKIDTLRKVLEVLTIEKPLVSKAADFRLDVVDKLHKLVKQL